MNKPSAAKRPVVLYAALSALAVAAALLAYTYASVVPGLKRTAGAAGREFPFLDPAAGLIGKGDLLVNFQALRDSLESQYARRDDFLVSLYFEYLPTGANIAVNRDERIWPASLIKVPVAMAAMKKVQDGEWKLTNELVILDEDKDSTYGDLHRMASGTTLAIEDLFRETLVDSDNTAHFVLLRNLDGSELEDVYNHLGLDDVIDALKQAPKGTETDNRISAKRYSVFFRSLYNGTYLSPEFSNLFLSILSGAKREYLAAGLPEDVMFVHKSGIRASEGVWANSGIVYLPGRPYILTVMLQKKDGTGGDEAAATLFKQIASEIHAYVAQARP